MQFICLIYTNEADEAAASQAERDAVYAAYGAYGEEIRAAGVHVVGEAFHPTSEAKTVSIIGGTTQVVAGPAVSTPDVQLTGFYILNAPDMDAAVAWAAKIPSAPVGKIEVRPLVDFSGN